MGNLKRDRDNLVQSLTLISDRAEDAIRLLGTIAVGRATADRVRSINRDVVDIEDAARDLETLLERVRGSSHHPDTSYRVVGGPIKDGITYREPDYHVVAKYIFKHQSGSAPAVYRERVEYSSDCRANVTEWIDENIPRGTTIAWLCET